MTITVTWLGHATVVVDMDGVRIVSDPLLRRHNGILRRRGATPEGEAWSGADAVLLSHLHHDHAEVGSLRMLGGVPVLTAPENAVWVAKKGLVGRGLGEGEWVPVGAAGDVAVRLVPAVHHSRPMPHRPNAANGHLVRGPSGVVWLAGDTDLYPGMEGHPKLGGLRGRRGRRPGRRVGAAPVPGAHGTEAGRDGVPARGCARCGAGALADPARPGRRTVPARLDGPRRAAVRGGPGPRGAVLPAARAGRRIVGQPALTGPGPRGLIRCG